LFFTCAALLMVHLQWTRVDSLTTVSVPVHIVTRNCTRPSSVRNKTQLPADSELNVSPPRYLYHFSFSSFPRWHVILLLFFLLAFLLLFPLLSFHFIFLINLVSCHVLTERTKARRSGLTQQERDVTTQRTGRGIAVVCHKFSLVLYQFCCSNFKIKIKFVSIMTVTFRQSFVITIKYNNSFNTQQK
jgi:hypothetical protein